MKYLCLLLLTSTSAFAGPALGGVYGSSKCFVFGDYNLFNQVDYVYGVQRYGGGSSRVQLGNGLGLALSADSGIILNQDTSSSIIYPKIGLEMFSGNLVVNTNDDIEDFYQWLPSISLGPQIRLGGIRLLIAGKLGGSISNLGKEGILPMFHNTFGVGVYLNDYIAFNHTVIGDNYVRSLDIGSNEMFSVRIEDKKGTLKETSGLLMIRIQE